MKIPHFLYKSIMIRNCPLLLLLLLFSGCSSVAIIQNEAGLPDKKEAYSILNREPRGDGARRMSFIVAFSGGGTRAAALAYGVLEGMRDTPLNVDGRNKNMLDEIDVISSVSGGSFTAAYYGLYGDRLFDEFPDVFLRRDIESRLIHGLLNPLEWFSSIGRTDMAVQLYEKAIFHNATFADMYRSGGPLILINASDLSGGVRFSFVQEYFDLLCSDITNFPVARAVTASSAVPILFDPVVLQNHEGCSWHDTAWLNRARHRMEDNPEMAETLQGLESYGNKKQRNYIHYVDGGITDNLGLRAIQEVVEVTGGAKAALSKLNFEVPDYLVAVVVNAATKANTGMDQSKEPPSIKEVVDAVTDTQLHRYNAATMYLMQQELEDWARELSTREHPVKPYFINVALQDLREPEQRQYFNAVPTSFSLTDGQVDALIAAGRNLLVKNPEYQSLVRELGGTLPKPRPLVLKIEEKEQQEQPALLDL